MPVRLDTANPTAATSRRTRVSIPPRCYTLQACRQSVESHIAAYEIDREHIHHAIPRVAHDFQDDEGGCHDKEQEQQGDELLELPTAELHDEPFDIRRQAGDDDVDGQKPVLARKHREHAAHQVLGRVVHIDGYQCQRPEEGDIPQAQQLLRSETDAVPATDEHEEGHAEVAHGIVDAEGSPPQRAQAVVITPEYVHTDNHHDAHQAQQFDV